MTPRTPMGPAVRGSRLDRLAEAQRIIQILIEQGETGVSIAHAIGCHPSTLGDWRRGERAPTAAWLQRLRALASTEGEQP